jgi:hypothetical protein
MMGIGSYYNFPTYRQDFYDHCRGWELSFAWLPKTCLRTGKKIWLEYGYRGTATWRTGDNDFMYKHDWHDKHEHLIWILKNENI